MMGTFIMKINDEKDNTDYYLEWSNVVDAPVTNGMSLDEFKEYYKERYGSAGMERLYERMKRVSETGVSAHPPFDKIHEYFAFNRAGENDCTLSKEEILNHYCR